MDDLVKWRYNQQLQHFLIFVGCLCFLSASVVLSETKDDGAFLVEFGPELRYNLVFAAWYQVLTVSNVSYSGWWNDVQERHHTGLESRSHGRDVQSHAVRDSDLWQHLIHRPFLRLCLQIK